VDAIDHSDLARRIEDARKELDNASSPEHRTRLEDFLHQLMTLQGTVIPA